MNQLHVLIAYSFACAFVGGLTGAILAIAAYEIAGKIVRRKS